MELASEVDRRNLVSHAKMLQVFLQYRSLDSKLFMKLINSMGSEIYPAYTDGFRLRYYSGRD